MTVRNQPRGKVKIEQVVVKPKQAMIPSGGGNFRLTADPEDQFGYNYLVTLRDHAQVTEDGYVTSGVKIKTGMKILVEGMDFQIAGVIVDVQAAPDAKKPVTKASDVKRRLKPCLRYALRLKTPGRWEV